MNVLTLMAFAGLLNLTSARSASIGTTHVIHLTGNNMSLTPDQLAYTEKGSNVEFKCSSGEGKSRQMLTITNNRGDVLEASRSDSVSFVMNRVTCLDMGVYRCKLRLEESNEHFKQILNLGVNDCPPKLCSNEESFRAITSDIGSNAKVSVCIIATVSSLHYPAASIEGVMLNGTNDSSRFDFSWERSLESALQYDLTITIRNISVDDYGYWSFKIYSSLNRYIGYQVLVKPNGNPRDVRFVATLHNSSRFSQLECEAEGHPKSMSIVINSKLIKSRRNNNDQYALRLWDLFYLQSGVGSLVCLVTDYKGENITKTIDVLYFKDTQSSVTSQHNVLLEHAHLHVCPNETNERKYYITLGAQFQISICVTTDHIDEKTLNTSLTMYANGRHLSTSSNDLRIEKGDNNTYAVIFTLHKTTKKDLTNYLLFHRLDHPFEQYVHTFILEEYGGPPLPCPGEPSQRTATAEIGTTASIILCVLPFPELGVISINGNEGDSLTGMDRDAKISVRYYRHLFAQRKYVEIEIRHIDRKDFKTYRIQVVSMSQQALLFHVHLIEKTAIKHERLKFTVNDFQPITFLGYTTVRVKKHSSITIDCRVENSNGMYRTEIRNKSADSNMTVVLAKGETSSVSHTLTNIDCWNSGIFECHADSDIKRFRMIIALNVLDCSQIQEVPLLLPSQVECPTDSIITQQTHTSVVSISTYNTVVKTDSSTELPFIVQHKEISKSLDAITIAAAVGFLIGSFLTVFVVLVCFKVLQYRKRQMKNACPDSLAVHWRNSSEHVYDKIAGISRSHEILFDEN